MPIIKVEMMKGRTIEQKRALAKVFTEKFAEICGTKGVVQVLFTDKEAENWAIDGELMADKEQK